MATTSCARSHDLMTCVMTLPIWLESGVVTCQSGSSGVITSSASQRRIPIPASVSWLVLRLALAAALIAGLPRQAAAWGDEGHQVIALVADHFLAPAARQRVAALLATDDSLLTQHDMASEATWAD